MATHAEFQEYVREFSLPETLDERRNELIECMRNNVLERNNQEDIYVIRYAEKGRRISILNASQEYLREMDYDLHHCNR